MSFNMWSRIMKVFGVIVALCINDAIIFDHSCLPQTNPQNSNDDLIRSHVWVADNSDGTYTNPIIYADYSDPDVVCVGDDFYMTASSFNCVPGLPILHSKDLVNWEIANHALPRLYPLEVYNKPQHGNGVWAPSIRYHDGKFYIYYGDPDFGIYLVRTKHILDQWEKPLLMKEANGWIDPCPFWDDDGNAYLIHAYAGSRAGIKSILVLHKMNQEGTMILDDGVIVFDGHDAHPTIEGPKMYRRNGYYYIFAPAGGVKTGWQTVLRSKNIYGPYEAKIVMDQGRTNVNGPHQGAWVELASGESWFIHFQDHGAYGRIVHLQPVNWLSDWPLIGVDPGCGGKGEPVGRFNKPNIGKTFTVRTHQTSDEFNSNSLGLQWQWHANPQQAWGIPFPSTGVYRLYAFQLPDSIKNLWQVPNLLLQKMTAPEFKATTKVVCNLRTDGEKIGLIVMGTDYAYLSIRNIQGKLYITEATCFNANDGGIEKEFDCILMNYKIIYLRVVVSREANCKFSYSIDGEHFIEFGSPFLAKPGKWIGSKIGLFCVGATNTNDAGYADVDWFRIERL